MEQVFTHVAVKTEFTIILGGLAKTENLGRFLADGILLSNFAADISGSPDGTFISKATRASDRIRLIEGSRGGFTEIQGSPDMVLEVISDSSVSKDDVRLRQAYWDADVAEYWIVDVRKDRTRFDILRRGAKKYTAARRQDGWVRSDVFGRSFRLAVTADEAGDPVCTLEVK
jgi:Uma2 family endonuclease